MPAPRRRPTRRHGERGVSVIIVALMFTALFSAAAFAVDIGALYTERRHGQNTVDAAVMSGAVEAVHHGGSAQQVADEVLSKVDITLGRSVSDAEWESCTDGSPLGHTAESLALTPATECISFSLGFDELRVKLPSQEVEGIFGPALGFANKSTTAIAQARIAPATGGGAPPFIALEGTAKGDFVCLRKGGDAEPPTLLTGNGPGNPPTDSGNADPCDTDVFPTDSSTFGTVKPHGYERGCTQQNQDVELAISVGMDHLLGYFPGGYDTDGDGFDSRTRVDGDPGPGLSEKCTMPFPNTLEVDEGFTAQMLRCSLLSEKIPDLCNDEIPRLQQGTTVQDTYAIVGERFDNTPVWDLMRSASDLYIEGAPLSCVIVAAARAGDDFDLATDDQGSHFDAHRATYPNWEDQYWDDYDFFDFFADCMVDWSTGDPELFDADIADYPRFAFIPKVHESAVAHGEYVHIEAFIPIYLHRLYISVSGTPGNNTFCDPNDPRGTGTAYHFHDAGGQYDCGATNKNIDRLASIALDCGMLPDVLCDKETTVPEGGGLDVYDIRLTI